MAISTKKDLRSLNIYQVFLRQHTKKGTFNSLINDLPRIKSLGMNYIYLLPIHPIGKTNRKGTIGSPYSVVDYYAVDESYGTINDFKNLVEEANKLDLKIMLDMVFHHTAYDAVLYNRNQEWYNLENGLPTQKIKDWSDVIDLDFSNEKLHDYLIDVLMYWISLGVKGFRFDVASLIPLEFWLKARQKVLEKNDDIVFLGESVYSDFVKLLRDQNYNALSDSELYQAFDILYDYDVLPYFYNYLEDNKKLNDWLKALLNQESVYPSNYIKLRNLENHDTNRIAYYIKDGKKLLNLTALLGFLKGTMMIYGGQEFIANKRPSLFEIDKVQFNQKEEDINNLIHKISHLRKDDLFQTGIYKIYLQDFEVAIMSYENEMSIAYGIFNLGGYNKELSIDLKDGVYQNILYPQQVKINKGKLKLTEMPMILFAMKKQI